MPITQASQNMNVTNGNPTIMRSTLLMAVKLYEDEPRQTFYGDIAGKILTTEQAYEESATVSGIGLPLITSEYGQVPTDDVYTPYTKRHQPVKRTLQLRISDEAFINDQYGIIKQYGTLLKGAFEQAKEIAAAVYLNGCLSTSLLALPSGQPLSSSAHPLDPQVGANDTNTFATQQVFGVIALEDAVNNLMMQKAHKGYPAPKPGPFVLEVHPKNALLARRIVASTQLPGTSNNDKNVVAGSISKLIASPYYTNQEWWSLRSASNNEHKRFMLQRYGFKLVPITYDEDNDSWKVTAKESYLFDAMDYRGTFYSTPS